MAMGCGGLSFVDAEDACWLGTEEACFETAASVLRLEVPEKLILGEAMQLCLVAQGTGIRPDSLKLTRVKVLGEGQEMSLRWKLSEEKPLRICREAVVPAYLNGDTLSLEVRAEAEDTVGNPKVLNESLQLKLSHTACSYEVKGLENRVQQPLAAANGRLVFAADAHLYFFETALCAMGATSPLHTGVVQGPMVVLGDTGRVALALKGEGPQGNVRQYLALVEAQGFIEEQACLQDASAVSFNKGLSLLEQKGASTPWRLMAPANNSAVPQSHVVLYTPEGTSRCIDSESIELLFPALIPMAQKANGEMVGLHGAFLGEGSLSALYPWSFSNERLSAGRYTEYILEAPPTVMALSDNSPKPVINNASKESPAAIDSQGRAYMVTQTLTGYQLKRYAAHADPHANPPAPLEAVSFSFADFPVGSPLLGEAIDGRPAEVYVVTTGGQVWAFEAARLGEPLWTENLGIHISPGAQPVLLGNGLWVVGVSGEIRGLRVGSAGLNRKAYWPKAFRDNCNTSSRKVKAEDMLSCF